MRQRLYIGLISILLLYGCGETTKPSNKPKQKIKLTFEVIPEDFSKNLYYVEWQDTLGQSEGYLPENIFKRPKEMWCVITKKNKDTLGYYKGLSTPQTFAYFQAQDTIVTFNFVTALAMFSDKFDNDKEGRSYRAANKVPVEFEPLDFNLKNDLRKKFEIEFKEK